MSVRGEFQRVLSDCLAFLEQSDGADRAGLAADLAAAGARADEDLSAGARMALEAMATCPPAAAGFAHTSDRKAFEALAAHLREICRAILGH